MNCTVQLTALLNSTVVGVHVDYSIEITTWSLSTYRYLSQRIAILVGIFYVKKNNQNVPIYAFYGAYGDADVFWRRAWTILILVIGQHTVAFAKTVPYSVQQSFKCCIKIYRHVFTDTETTKLAEIHLSDSYFLWIYQYKYQPSWLVILTCTTISAEIEISEPLRLWILI